MSSSGFELPLRLLLAFRMIIDELHAEKIVRLTPRGADALTRSARIFGTLRARWAAELGEDRLQALEADLRTMTPANPWRLDTPGWFGNL
ncbi:hypothetical protein ACFMQL_12320 [Nonomuraea fastidiosa]|uniref:hypothetical protein n=1 Tax=Nonomuraea TaxID=83681 RepID=UPI00325642EA